MNRKKIIKILLIILVNALLPILIEILCFNNMSNSGYTKEFNLSNSIKDDTSQIYYFSLDKSVYIKKLVIDYTANDDIKYEVITSKVNNYNKLTEKRIEDSLSHVFSKAYTNINSNIKELKIIFPNDTNLTINKISINNIMVFNKYRLLGLYSLLLIMTYLIFANKIIDTKLEISFIVIGLIVGLNLIINISPDIKSWDEHIHYQRIYDQSFLHNITLTESAQTLEYLKIPSVNTYEEKDNLKLYLNKLDDNIISNRIKGIFITPQDRGYITQSIMLAVARLLNTSFTTSIVMGKMGNLFLYLIMCYLAIKYAKIGKRLIVIVALLPTPIFLASSFSYDPIVIAGSLLAISIFISEIVDSNKKLNTLNTLLFIAGVMIASFPKAVYAPLILLALFFNKNKFYNKKQQYLFKSGVIFIFILLIMTFVLPTMMGEIGGDLRGGDTNVSEQLRLIFSHPLSYCKILLYNIYTNVCTYFVGPEATLHYAYIGNLGYVDNNSTIITMLLIIFVAVVNNDEVINYKYKILLGITIFIIVCLIWTALYLSFTPVGLDIINGVQPRYYLPVLVPLMYICNGKKIQCSFQNLNYNRITLIIISLISFEAIFKLVILP